MRRILLFFGVVLCWISGLAQDTITTSPPLVNNNGQSGITFEVESTQPVNIIGLHVLFTSGTSANLWMRTGGVQHAANTAPTIDSANGWIQVITNGTVTGANSTTPVALDFNGGKISVPANTRIGFFVDGSVGYQTGTAADPTTFTDGVMSVIVDDNAAYGGGRPNPTFNPRRFLGSVIYELGVVGNCTPFTNFTIDSISAFAAKVDWTPAATSSSFFLEYGPLGFTPGSAAGTKITGTYPGTQPPVILSGLTPVTQYDVYFGEICNSGADSSYFPTPQTFQTTVTCPPPFNLTDLGTTGTTGTVAWQTVNSAGAKLEWGPVGFQQGTGTTASTTDTSFVITGLTPLTTYHVYIADSCAPSDQSTYAGPLSITTGCNAPLNGAYTLNSSQAYSSTNFTSFSQLALAFDLCGVSGPVTIDVDGGTYNEQIVFSEISGASATNTVTINGNGSTLSFLSSSTMDRATLKLNGTDHLTIDSLNVVSQGSASGEYGAIVWLTNGANYNIIRNCNLRGDTSSTSSNFAGFGISGSSATSGSITTQGVSGNYNLIENNTITGGYYGLTMVGSSTDSANGNIIRDNIIRDYRYYGMYVYYNEGITLEGNDISRPNRTNLTTSYGMYMYGMIGGSVIGNRVHDPFTKDESVSSTSYGMYMGQFLGTAAKPNLVANNMIYNLKSGGAVYGFYPNTASHTRFVHNSVIYNNPASSATSISYPMYLVGTLDEVAIQNNLVYLQRGGTGTKYLVYLSGTLTPSSVMDNNAYYATDSTTYSFGYSGGAISDFGQWQADTKLDSNSFFADPYLVDVANLDFTPQSAVIDNLGDDFSAYVANDITGATRGTPSDPGAIEFTAAACTGLSGLSLSNVTASAGTISWTTNTTPVTIEWGPQGFTQGSGVGTLINVASGITTASITGLTSNTCYDYYVIQNCTSSIPGAPPVVGPLKLCTGCATAGLSGTYTVGGAAGPTNFATLDSAISTLNNCGILGPVVFNLNGGVHNAFTLTSVPGASATNTITFNGSGTLADSIIATSGTAAIELDGAAHVSLNNIYAENNGGTFVVWMHDGAAHISIDNAMLVGSRTTTSTSAVVAASNSSTSATSSGYNANYVSITNSKIVGNYYGISIYGSSTTSHGSTVTIANNQLEDQYYYGIRTYYMDTITIEKNLIPSFRNSTSYGIQAYYGDYAMITQNMVLDAYYAMYIYGINRDQTSAAYTSTVANNIANGSYAGMYSYYNAYTNFYHNTAQGGTYGIYVNGSSSYSNTDVTFKNNIFVNNGTGRAMYIGTEPTNLVLDYNLYYSPNGDLAYQGSAAQTSLSAWQTAYPTQNANSVEGDPMFVASNDLHVLGALANDVGDNSVGITVDVDGDVRPASGSTVVDMGADEYTPVSSDLSLLAGEFIRNRKCLSTDDSIVLHVQNAIGGAVNFGTTPVIATYDVSGPVNSSGTISVNSGTLASLDTVQMFGLPVDLSVPGVYTLSAFIHPSTDNNSALNDSLFATASITIYPNWVVNPDSVVVISNTIDTVELEARSPFFGGSDFFISEVAQYKYSVGAPAAGWPSYLLADDYIEITGVPGSDLGGITLEQWSTTAIMSTHTFPQGTLLGPNGTAIIAVGQLGSSAPSPSDFYYHGNGSYTSSFSSGGSNGRILKDANGVIIDAVGYGSTYTFPATSGVTAAEWSGNTASSTSTSGIRLEGPDLNNASNWVVSSSSPQDPNTVNSNVPVPVPGSIQGFSWALNGTAIDTLPNTVVGPYTVSGVYHYVATYSSPCGVYTDTVTVLVNVGTLCTAPTNIGANVLTCDSVDLSWNTAADSTLVWYVATGTTPSAQGMLVISDSTLNITGTSANTAYDVYVANICNGDTSAVTGPYTFNTGSVGAPVASFTGTAINFGLAMNFDASGSTGNGNSYAWDFGDGNTGVGVNPTHTYTNGGNYSVTLSVTNACGTDDTTIAFASIGMEENVIGRSLVMYPNPTRSELSLSFDTEGAAGAVVRVLEISGKEVKLVREQNTSGHYQLKMDLSDLADGVYMVEITSGNTKAVRRLIKG